METYTIRDKDGIMIAKVSGNSADSIISNANGYWRKYVTKGSRTTCFEIKTDSHFTIESNYGGIRLFLWEGTVLISENSYD